MAGVTTRLIDLGYGYAANIRTEVSGEGNSLRTRVTTVVDGPATRRMHVDWVDRATKIETEGEWEAAVMATLLRSLAEALDGEDAP